MSTHTPSAGPERYTHTHDFARCELHGCYTDDRPHCAVCGAPAEHGNHGRNQASAGDLFAAAALADALTAAEAERDKWHATANMRMGMLTAARGRAEAAEADMVRYKLYNDELVAMKATPAAGYEFWYHRAIAAEAERDRWKRMWDDEGTKANQALRKLAALQEAAEKVAVHLGVLNATQGPRPTEEWLLILEACAQEGAAARAKLAAVEALCAERDRQWNRLGGLHVGVAEVRAALRAGVPAAGDGPNT
jgi:hypothetical protein